MSYTALYRKFRPQQFHDVVGQGHIIQTLENQIKADRIAHAYLFCGTRGTGKTSTAKIFAKAVNCLAPENGNPCNACSICNSVNQNQSMNVIEIDAASNNGVDNIREIREEVKYTPAEGKYKVYIIDEVHMLSTGAFNALLKTLEEPPAHVIFILATTEPHKIPATILSRCQRYDFKRITQKQITEQLTRLTELEKVEIETRALEYIAKVADGSMRDGLSILDQCIAFYLGKKVTFQKVLDLLGAVDTQVFFDMTNAIRKKDATEVMKIIEEITVAGRDLQQFTVDWMTHLRNLLICQSTKNPQDILDMSEEQVALLKKQAKEGNGREIIRIIRILSELEGQLRFAANKRILLEVTVIKFCEPEMNTSEDVDMLMTRIEELERKVNEGIPIVSGKEVSSGNGQQPMEKPKVKPKAVPQEVKEAVAKWPSIRQKLKKSIPIIDDIQAGYLEGDTFYLITSNIGVADIFSRKNTKERIEQTLEQLLKKTFHIEVIDQLSYERKYSQMKGLMTKKDQEDIDEKIASIRSKINMPIQVK